MPRLIGIDTNRTGNAADHLAPAHDVGNALFIDAVLEGHDEAVWGQVLLDHHRSPLGIVGLGTDEGDIHRLFEQALHLVQMQSLKAYRVLALRAAQMNAVVLDVLDVLRPWVNQGDILASACEMPTDIAPDCSSSHKDYALAHATPPLRCRSPAARALCYTRFCSGIVARPPVEHQTPLRRASGRAFSALSSEGEGTQSTSR